MSKQAIVQEIFLSTDNHTASDQIPLPPGTLQVTIKALPSSAANVRVGWNMKASDGNFLEAGDSATYDYLGYYLDQNNRLYVGFDAAGGFALVSIIFDPNVEPC